MLYNLINVYIVCIKFCNLAHAIIKRTAGISQIVCKEIIKLEAITTQQTRKSTYHFVAIENHAFLVQFLNANEIGEQVKCDT